MKIYLVWWYDILLVIKLDGRREIPWRVSHRAEKAVERFPELGCFAVAVRRIVYEKGMTLDNAIKKSGISKSAWFAGMAGSGGKPTRLPSLASFFAIADGLGITPEELIAAMRKEAEVREKSNGERAENDE